MVLVDSCCWIESLKKAGKIEVKAALQGILDEFEAVLCGPVELEVLGGAKASERKRIQSYFNILPYRASNHTIWREAVHIHWKLRDAGITVPWNDTIIATIAVKFNYRVYSIDKHFPLMADILAFPLYEPGYGGRYNAS